MLHSLLRILTIVAAATGVAAGYVGYHGLRWVPDVKAIEEKQRRHETLRQTRAISLDELKALLEVCGVIVLDGRPSDAFEEAHLAIACDPPVLNVPPETVQEQLARLMPILDFGLPLVLYCTSEECDLAEELLTELELLGFTDIRIYFPGWEGLVAANMPAESGPDLWGEDGFAASGWDSAVDAEPNFGDANDPNDPNAAEAGDSTRAEPNQPDD